MIYLIIAILLILAIPLYAILRSAPEGYEDKTGFHRGKKK